MEKPSKDLIDKTLELLDEKNIRCPKCSKVLVENLQYFDIVKCSHCGHFVQVIERTKDTIKIKGV